MIHPYKYPRITVMLAGAFGRQVQAYLTSTEDTLALPLVLWGEANVQPNKPDSPNAKDGATEEVVMIVAEQKDLTPALVSEVLQKYWPGQEVYTLALAPEVKTVEKDRQQQAALAAVDAMIVLPAPATESDPTEDLQLETLRKVLSHFKALLIDNLTSEVMIDFEDIKTVLKSKSPALVGIGKARGENRAQQAVERATSLPFMQKEQLHNVQRLLLQIDSGGKVELEMEELTLITDAIQEMCGYECEVIFGHRISDAFTDEIEVFLLAVH